MVPPRAVARSVRLARPLRRPFLGRPRPSSSIVMVNSAAEAANLYRRRSGVSMLEDVGQRLTEDGFGVPQQSSAHDDIDWARRNGDWA